MHRIRQVNADTGEVLGGMLVYIPPRCRISHGWFMAFQEGLEHLAKAGNLTAREFRVLCLLMARLDFENFIHLSQADVARELGLRASHVSAAFRRLVEEGCLIVGPKVGRSATYRLAPELGWKGRVRNLEEARKRGLHVVLGTPRDPELPLGNDEKDGSA